MQELKNLQKLHVKNKQRPHISISHENYEKLKKLGTCGDSFNDVLDKILAKQVGVYKIDTE
jgi:predicted CopG family antitoxin